MTDQPPTLKIIITIQGQPITLTIDQARELRDLLNQVVPEKKAAVPADWKIDYAELIKKFQERPKWPSPMPTYPTLPPYEPLPWSPPFNPTAKPYWLEAPRTFCVDLEAEKKRFMVDYDKLPSYAATVSLKWNGAGEQVPDISEINVVA